ncbi:Exonuclease/helicase-like [Parasponia andersonii]|uniref:Exonuclease/helicase-like n=1 Tax=Parasponia andersonii TaxID=3476 RepID=A0A2P5DR08_PARAD|nr:Exonuclease/helicase-like [Parasponia andersonii]
MALERQASFPDKMQMYCEASTRCLHGEAIPHNLQYNNGNFEEGSSKPKDETGSLSLGGITEGVSLDSTYFVPPSDCYHGPFYQQDFYVWSAYPDNQKAQQNHFYALENHSYAMHYDNCIPDDSRFQYLPFKKLTQSYQSEFQFQEFQYFVVIDFEATCDKEKNPHPQEIIEFPSVLVNSMTGQLEDQFQVYVRPTHNQHLSDFCKELTGIQQTQVDKGVLLSEALLLHDKWLEEKGVRQTNFAVVTWSNWDCQVMLESECRFKRIRKPPYFNRWINLKVPFNEVFGGIKCNLKEAVKLAGLVWEGRAHCGLDDAKNTARLLTNLMHRGFRFSITNSLMWQTAELPLKMHQLVGTQPSFAHQPHRMKHQVVPLVQFHQIQVGHSKEQYVFCYCGVKSRKLMVQKPGPKHGCFFFGCGNWTATRGAVCPYFEWATV